MIALFAVLSAILLALTLLPLWKHPHWVVRVLDFPRLQLAILALLLGLAELYWLPITPFSTLLIASSLFCLVWQARWIAPYTRLWKIEVRAARDIQEDRCLSIITSNVLTPNRKAERLIHLVKERKPDILVTLESDQWWQDQLDILESEMPHTLKCPLDNLYGMHVYSRLPLEDTEISYLVEDSIPSMHGLVRLRSGEGIRVHFLHPSPPSPTENEESAERDAELVIVARSVAKRRQPVIVTGDLNDVAWSRTTRLFRKLSHLLDPRIGRGMFNTFHAKWPFLRWPLDHIFHSEHFSIVHIERLPTIGSDHFPLYTRLLFTPQHNGDQEGIDADKEDKEFADDIEDDQSVGREQVPTPGRR
ncbi:MAG: endonuclease/exonuclease/phosphatase family protein [Saccharospirillum sp.]|uniref:endonuclease/exonuclease/phosphatase family protein n=1 Tax=Saccharospirillum sp. TaxID=2033801 RepID=UPI0032972C44